MTTNSILIIEDEESIRISLECFLKEKKYVVKSSSDGLMALEMIERDHYDLIVLDLYLDGMNGIELLKEIRKISTKILVFIITGNAKLDTSIEALRLGASDYLIKPFSNEQLYTRILSCVESKDAMLIDSNNVILEVVNGDKKLTKQESLVGVYLLKGFSDYEIAQNLYLSVYTIRFHLKNIYKKTGFSGRKDVMKRINENRLSR